MHIHTIPPVFDENSKILILGSFPSLKSRERGFFYAHPQNRFWHVLAYVFERPLPESTEEKKELLLSCNVALWDVIQSCNIEKSKDSSIRNVIPNDIEKILKATDIQQVFAGGQTAGALYNKYIYPKTLREIEILPSTSSANGRYSLERLCEEWKIIRNI